MAKLQLFTNNLGILQWYRYMSHLGGGGQETQVYAGGASIVPVFLKSIKQGSIKNYHHMVRELTPLRTYATSLSLWYC